MADRRFELSFCKGKHRDSHNNYILTSINIISYKCHVNKSKHLTAKKLERTTNSVNRWEVASCRRNWRHRRWSGWHSQITQCSCTVEATSGVRQTSAEHNRPHSGSIGANSVGAIAHNVKNSWDGPPANCLLPLLWEQTIITIIITSRISSCIAKKKQVKEARI